MSDQQAGIRKISLIEARNISFYHTSENETVTDLNYQGEKIDVFQCSKPEMKLSDRSMARNGDIYSDITLDFNVIGFTKDKIDLINKLKKSIYGWCPLVYYLDGTVKIWTNVLVVKKSDMNNVREFAFYVKMNSVREQKEKWYFYDEFANIPPYYRADSTLITVDSTLISADYEL